MSREEVTCMQCGATVVPADRFCESCGAILRAIRRVAIPGPATALDAPCADCGNETYVDDYCTACGNRRAEPARDQADLDGIVLITDRGLEHPRNEDAAAAGIVAGAAGEQPPAIAVTVCDGVSTSADAQARRGERLDGGRRRDAACARRFATGAVGGAGGPDRCRHRRGRCGSRQPGSDHGTVVHLCGGGRRSDRGGTAEITVGNVGDSRVYWLPEPPAPAQCLTVDDSVAQELITAGVPADSEAVQAGAHTLTRWLGADAEPTPWSESSVRTHHHHRPRACCVMCTDGLWNYLPEADDIARFCIGADADAAARALVDYALAAGGHDNITVAVIPIGGLHEYG